MPAVKKFLLSVAFGVTAWGTARAVSMEAGTAFTRSSYPASVSGITCAGGHSYYAISDNGTGSEGGLYPYTITLSADGKTVSSATTCATNQAVRLSGQYDLEGVAYDPATGNIWMVDEGRKTIKAYDPATGAVVSTLDVPEIMEKNVSNYGFESLTISGDGLTMWTANEEALTCDGPRSSYTVATTVRLVKFTRPTVYDAFALAAMYPYTTEKWHAQYSYGGAGRRGVSDLCALPDGSLLVLERELSTGVDGTGWDAAWDALFYYQIFRVANPSAATDVKNVASLSNVTWTAVGKTSLASGSPWVNYEGICLGPRISEGKTSVLLVADGGDGNSGKKILPLVLVGLDVHTLAFNAPSEGTASVSGANYRFLTGAKVDVTLTGTGVEPVAYTNDGAAVFSSTWALPNHMPAAGTEPSMSFTVAADDTLVWTLTGSTAVSDIEANDTFEGYAVWADAPELASWSGDGEVVAHSYAPPTPPGYPMTRAAHTKVLDVDGSAARCIPDAASANRKFDVMVCVQRPQSALVNPADDVQILAAADEGGRLCLWHLFRDGDAWVRGWTRLSDAVYADGSWVRIGIELDYTTSPVGDAFARVTINGSYCPTGRGVRAPDDTTAYGVWHYLAKNRLSGGVVAPREVGFSGTKVDDLLITASAFAAEQSGPSSTNGVDFAWFDGHGLPRDPDAAAPFIGGYTLKDVHDSGVEPYSDKPLTIIRIGRDGNGKLQIGFNGYKGDDPGAGYRIIRSPTPDFKSSTVLGPSDGDFQGDRSTWSTTWGSDVPNSAADAEFYKVDATRP